MLTRWDTFLSFLVTLATNGSCKTTQDREKTSKIVFRVRGIPYGKSLRSISVALSASPLKLRSKDIWMDVDESTIVPDCYGSNTQMALIQFIPRPPDELQSLRINETYTLRLYRSGEQITVDKDFFGHTQLYPTTGQIAAEHVFLPPPLRVCTVQCQLI